MKGTFMNKIETAKYIANAIVKMGTGAIVYNIIHKNIPVEDRGPVQTVTVPAASFVIGGMAAEATEPFTNRLIDEVVENWQQIKNMKN